VKGPRPVGSALIVLALGLALTLAAAAPAAASAIFDYITFDGIDYLRWPEEPGRALTRDDLGIEFATVECSFGEDLLGCPFGMDGSAAFLPAGTRVYAVRGYRTSFRLAAVWQDRIFLYQAWRNPHAKTGGDLWAIGGKVRTIDVQRGEPVSERRRAPASITGASDVEALVRMIVGGPVGRPRPPAAGDAHYWLRLWLIDGTVLERPYFPETGELLGGVTVPEEFRRVLDRYLAE